MKKLSLILILLLFSTNSYSEGYECHFGMSNESFKKEDEELREYGFKVFLHRREWGTQFYERNGFKGLPPPFHQRLVDYTIIMENSDVIHMYQTDNDYSINTINIDKNKNYFTQGWVSTYGLVGGYNGRCKFITTEEVKDWELENIKDDEYSMYEYFDERVKHWFELED